jgi:N-acetylglucosaminyldiphosphoundecaprenol N-acetyl-beta-D-mannosaminyltransferase
MNSRYSIKPPVERILGFEIYAAPLAGVISQLFSNQPIERPVFVACFNPHSFGVARKDSVFKAALSVADILVPDGVGVVLASTIGARLVNRRVTGSDVFHEVSAFLSQSGGKRVFLLGSSKSVLAKIERRLAIDYPSILVAGAFSPRYTDVFDDSEIIRMRSMINESRSDVLWVALTQPKQEKLIVRLLPGLQVSLVAGIGAVFEFYAGSIQRPSKSWQRLGLEWLPRLIREPRRLWRRTIVSAPVFAYYVLLERVRSRTAH